MSTSDRRPRGNDILLGTAYYSEYQLSDRVETDLDLMLEAGFTVIRVGESVWATWEPRDGQFDLDWLQPVLDGAHERGIGVILGTPTYAIPPWLQRKHPELLGRVAHGALAWGGRQEVDYTSPLFLHYAERVIRAVLTRYGDHPAVIGFQVDNEPGLHLLHNQGTFVQFVDWLRDRYGDVERINAEWGLVYWSHRLSEWSDLWRPEGNTLPQYDLAWRSFQSDAMTRYISWQADIAHEYARPDQFVTTCIAFGRAAVEDERLTARLDVTAGNPYFNMQEALDPTVSVAPLSDEISTGVWGLTKQADRMFSSRQERFLVAETNAGTISGSHQNYPPYPGQLIQSAFLLVARGAKMIEYWHWHALHFGPETYWGGVLPHSQVPGRIYREIAQLGGDIRRASSALVDYTPDADVVFLYSAESKWAMEFMPPLSKGDYLPDRRSYDRIFDAFYQGVTEVGVQTRIMHVDQFMACDLEEFVAAHPVLFAPALYVVRDAVLERLAAYGAAGGHLVSGPRIGYLDREGRARAAVAPPVLAEPSGVWYEDFGNLDGPVPLRSTEGHEFVGSSVVAWFEGLIANSADVIATFEHPWLGGFAALTTNRHGTGQITCVGGVPDEAFARAIARRVVPTPLSARWAVETGGPIGIVSGVNGSGQRVWFIHNWGAAVQTIAVPVDYEVLDQLSGVRLHAGSELELGAWSVRMLVEV